MYPVGKMTPLSGQIDEKNNGASVIGDKFC